MNPFAQANPFAAVASPFAAVANPFVASAADQGGGGYAINAPGGSDFDPNQPYTFSLVKSGPDVHPDEVETHAAAIEVIVKWDTNTPHVSYESPQRAFARRARLIHCPV
jgi:hypothetical protein